MALGGGWMLETALSQKKSSLCFSAKQSFEGIRTTGILSSEVTLSVTLKLSKDTTSDMKGRRRKLVKNNENPLHLQVQIRIRFTRNNRIFQLMLFVQRGHWRFRNDCLFMVID